MKSQKAIARTFGLFFLLAFLSYGLGTGLTTQITDADSLHAVTDHKTQFVLGVILMALVHTIVNIGLPVLMVPVLKPWHPTILIPLNNDISNYFNPDPICFSAFLNTIWPAILV